VFPVCSAGVVVVYRGFFGVIMELNVDVKRYVIKQAVDVVETMQGV